MNFAFSEEQEELRRIVRQFLDDKSDEQAVRALMATEKGYDDAVWRADGRSDGSAGPHRSRGQRRLGLLLCRADRRARRDGSFAAVRALLLDGRARRQHVDPQRRRCGEEAAPAGHRVGRHHRHARVHRGQRSVGRVGHHHGRHGVRRRLDAQRPQDVRPRRPCREPHHRRGPHEQGRLVVHRRRRRDGSVPHGVADHGPDAQAGPPRVRQHAGHACWARTATAGRCSSGCSTSPRSRWRPNRSAAGRSVST